MDRQKVAVGMSGGVDSSVAAALLVEQGYDVTGVFIVAYNEPGCRTDQDRKDALAVATQLGIRFEILDLRKEYKEKVIHYFTEEYQAGRTPNPDIVCNREIKFGLFYAWAMESGFDYVATGHYARVTGINPKSKISNSKQECYFLQQPEDLSKDQTYFLWQVPADHLEHVLFPLGEMQKTAVRAKARALGLPTASKPDSMGVCMLGELDVRAWLRERLGEKEGQVLLQIQNPKSKTPNTLTDFPVVGSHRGLWFHTLGQRAGGDLRISNTELRRAGIEPTSKPPLYVVGKNAEKNELIVGRREACYTSELRITNTELRSPMSNLGVRIRNLGEIVRVKEWSMVDGRWLIQTDVPVFAPTPGQSAVFYDAQGRVVGGGIIG